MGERFDLVLHQTSYTGGIKHMRRCSTPLVIREMKMKTRHHCKPIKMAN